VGTVVAVGSGVKDRTMGDRVGGGWQADSWGSASGAGRDEHLWRVSRSQRAWGGTADLLRRSG